MFRAIVILAFSLTAILAEQVSYEGYKVYQVTPTSEDHMTILKAFDQDQGFDFWSNLREVNIPVDIMVAPKYQNVFNLVLNSNGFDHKVIIEDVESKFNFERLQQALTPKAANGKISFTKYNRYEDIQSYLKTVAWLNDKVATVETIGQTFENRDIDMIKICKDGCGNKPAILVDCGIHAREWIAPATCLYLIDRLVETPENSGMIENVDWYIIPSLNPDGYEYTHTRDRMWRKTRSTGKVCVGTDPNRNFDFHWMETGASSNECSETYAGTKGFSELETQALRDFVLAHKDSGNIKLYLTFHSYGQYLLYPWGYTSALPEDSPELHALAVDAEKAIRAVDGTKYTIGSSTNVLYAAAGGSDDWVKAVGGVELSYTVELPGGGNSGFDLPPSRIVPVVEETWEGVKVYHQYIEDKFSRK